MTTRTRASTGRQGTTNGNGRKSATVFPVPRQLATPTDLQPDEVQAVTEAVNGLIGDAFALYVKTKNFHWHLASSHFRDYHLLFDEHAEQILESIDPMAERIRRIGGATVRSISHISQLQSIQDDNRDFVPAEEMIQALLADNLQIAKKMRDAMELAEEKRDHPTSNLLQEILDVTEKQIWFLYEISMGGQNQE
ncbi:MAG: DNA starvation/stationary phase protection protein [Caldilineaceae bacterium]